MAVTFTPDQTGDAATCVALASGWWMLGGKLTFSGDYEAGGPSLDLTKYLSTGGTIRCASPVHLRGMTGEYDKTNKKLKIWVGTAVTPAQAEHAAATYDSDITASAIDVVFFVKLG